MRRTWYRILIPWALGFSELIMLFGAFSPAALASSECYEHRRYDPYFDEHGNYHVYSYTKRYCYPEYSHRYRR
jgi:hypothetical protein